MMTLPHLVYGLGVSSERGVSTPPAAKIARVHARVVA